MEVSSELVVEGLLDEIKRLTMEIIMLRSAMKTLEEQQIASNGDVSDKSVVTRISN